ncbi:MAG: sterol desaturase family protein [Myxococcota bacterium]
MEGGFTDASAPAGFYTMVEGLIAALVLIALPIFAIEVWQLWSRGKLDGSRVRGMLTNLFCTIPYGLVQTAVGGGSALALMGVAAFVPWSIPTTWFTALACVLLVDFGYYWEHRLGHEVNWFWASFHATHHSANHFDQTVGARLSFTEHLLNWPALAILFIMVGLGFHPLLVVSSYGLVLAWQQWIHTETIGRLPWLDGWLNTPSNHRVHHGRNPEYLDRNYGGILMIWDRLFGTYAPEVTPVDYGLVHRVESHHPFWVHFSVWVKLGRRWVTAKDWAERQRLLFGPPATLHDPAPGR